MPDPCPNATMDSPPVSLLDYSALFVDHLLPIALCHGYVIFLLDFTIFLHQEVPPLWLGLAFGSLLVTFAICLLGGMVSSVQNWEKCVIVWRILNLTLYTRIMYEGNIFFEKYFDTGMCFFNTKFMYVADDDVSDIRVRQVLYAGCCLN